jgi:hypothetical protein
MVSRDALKPAVVVAGALFVSALILVTTNAPSADAQPSRPPMPVVVQNDAAIPVPVSLSGAATISGSVNIANQPTIDARQSGGWTVGAVQSGPWQVEVTNPPGQPQPFNVFQRFSLPEATPPDAANQIVIGAGRVLTDVMATGHLCSISMWIGAPTIDSLLFTRFLSSTDPIFEFHFTSGIAGPLTIGVAAPSGPGCVARLLLTGYEQ